MRRAALAVVVLLAGPAMAETVMGAHYEAPTSRYGHGALANGEWAEMVLQLSDGQERRVSLPEELVFEDTAPRLVDLTGDGLAEVVVVESHRDFGSRLAIWGPQGRRAAAEFIGMPYRWLAPLGAADFDGDGRIEFAYVLRPHLDATLTLVRLEGSALVAVAASAGLPNHRYREAVIEGGVADCADGVMILTSETNWHAIIATRLRDGRLISRTVGAYAGPGSFAVAAAGLGCRLTSS